MSVSMRKMLAVLIAAAGLFAGLTVPANAEVGSGVGGTDISSADANEGDQVGRITAGRFHTCAIGDEGKVRCWGVNNYGQLGSSKNVGTEAPNSAPRLVGSLPGKALEISAGYSHTCAIVEGGDVHCWGSNEFGQLGAGINSGTTLPNYRPMTKVPLLGEVVRISSGAFHTCAQIRDHGMQCWGSNAFGQLGVAENSGTLAANPVPTAYVALIGQVRGFALGEFHTCAVVDFSLVIWAPGAVVGSGSIRCWGSNQFGQLGVAKNSGTLLPNPEPSDRFGVGFGVLVSGAFHTCAFVGNNPDGVRCWGSNEYGQLGSLTNIGTVQPNHVPEPMVFSGPQATAASAGAAHTCITVHNSSQIRCWGANFLGQLGSDVGGFGVVPGLLPAVDLPGAQVGVTSGGTHSCAWLDTGDIYCWGSNLVGQLGSDHNISTTNANTTPERVVDLPCFQKVYLDAGSNQVCAQRPPGHGHEPSGSTDSYVTANLEELEAGPGEIRVHGWAYDPDLPSYDLVVHVYAFFDGVGDPVALGTPVVRAADFRPDINRAFDIEGDHGFNRSLKIRNGNHRVCVYSLSVDGTGELDDLNRLIGCRYVTVTDEAPPRGAFDVAVQTGTSMKVSGWAYDLDREDDSLAIQVFLDGAFFKTITANTSRPDVNQIVQISGDHGFNSTFTVPAGGHQVCLYVVGVDPTGAADGENVLLNVIDKPDCRNT